MKITGEGIIKNKIKYTMSLKIKTPKEIDKSQIMQDCLEGEKINTNKINKTFETKQSTTHFIPSSLFLI